MSERDAAYRRVFHHHQMLRDLLACVLEADWLRDLDWAGLREVNTQYVAERLQRRVGDGA
ncbi:hypothetical protein [Parapusillimonas granuli]|uniref:Uncharacterized protein n=1 Tax=Parapusillimonas granuli TaxID=380911 RepID=A0A853FSX1_9BURK|nr:hypothetical protein [Parapusillimonas granuli]MBB5216086.1 hypothetical protein [Parapusillimonas granuli]NYT47768.1 hypothetical protein [Parapusillimonas granuli]